MVTKRGVTDLEQIDTGGSPPDPSAPGPHTELDWIDAEGRHPGRPKPI